MSDEDTSHPEAEQPRPEDGTTQSLHAEGAPVSGSARAGTPVPPVGPAPSNETVSLSGGGIPSPATDPTLLGDAARPHAPHDGHAHSRKLGPYALVRLLGRGGMGAVWEALDTRLNRRVALKVMVAGAHATEQDTERFRREAQNSAKLRHPNIVPVHDFGIEGGQQYLVMDLVDGVVLADALRQRQFTYREKALLLEKVARAVHYAHGQGVIHRDLKPSNVMLEFAKGGSSSGEAKPSSSANLALPVDERAIGEPLVMDFGLAKDIAKDSSLSQSGQVMGTPTYMPPEQAEGRSRDIGPRSDVYSLGAILYEMLTGRVPFTGENAVQVLRAAVTDDPVLPRRITPGVPRDLETICLKCLEKDQALRYESAQALAEELGRWLRDEPIVARPAGPWERAAKWARRRPAAAALIAVSVLALVALAGGGLWYNARLAAALRETGRERDQKEQERQRAQDEAAEKEEQRQKAVENLRQAQERLAESLISQADALCLAGRPQESLDRYNEARATLNSLGEPTFVVETGIFELRNAYPPPFHTFSAHEGGVTSVAFSPEGELALSGSYDWGLKLWDVETGRELRTFRGHTREVLSVAFSPDGNSVLSGSRDRTLQLRDLARPARYREFDALLPKAREAIQKNENDAEALKTFGEWYAFRGVNGWAVDFLEKARKNGANVPPLTLARCYWLLAEEATVGRFAESPGRVGNSPHHRAAAAAEYQKELDRVKAQPAPQEAKGKLAREREELYLDLCLQAASNAAK